MKRNNAKRVLALVLASAMLLQQGSVGIFAAETETMTEAQTEQTTEAKVEETQAPAPETKAEETQAPATEAPAEKTKAEETQAPATEATEAPTGGTKTEETQTPTTEAPTGETKIEETQAPATEAPGAGTETEETQAPATEAPAETATEAPTEAVTEAPTEKETETETEEAVVLDTVITQEVFQKTVEDTVQPMVKYTVKVTNKAKTADAEDVSVKVLLAKALSYSKEDGETAEPGVYEKLEDAVNADVFKDIELDDAVKDAYTEGGVVLWKDQKIAAGEKKEFVFFAAVEDGVADTEALRNLWFVNDKEITGNGKIEWLNTDLLKVEKELPTEFIYDDGNMVVTATLSDGAILPEGAQFVVTEKTLSEEEKALIEESLDDEQTMTGYVAYDMHFEVDGKEVEPENGTVSVSVSYNKAQALAPVNEGEEAVPDEAEFSVLHISDDQTVENVTANVNTKKNGKLREVGFTTEEFSTYVVLANAPEVTGAPELFVENIHVGSRRFEEASIDDASAIYNEGYGGNDADHPYVVYVGETLELLAKNVSDDYTLTYGDQLEKVSEVKESTELKVNFIGATLGPCTITLKNKNGEEKNFFVDVHYPIYVEAAHGTYHKDMVHEFLEGLNYGEGNLYSPKKNSYDGYDRIYIKNSNTKNRLGSDPGPYTWENRGRYVVAPDDTIVLSAVHKIGDGAQFSSDLYAEIEVISRDQLGNGYEKVVVEVTPNDDAKSYSFNASEETPDENLCVRFGGESFYYEVIGGYSQHFDIEIADGGTYTVKVEEYDPINHTKTVVETIYNAYVSGINSCTVYGNNNEILKELLPWEYWQNGNDASDAQYELTSAYETTETDNNPNVLGQLKNGKTPIYRNVSRDQITNVVFDLKILLKSKQQVTKKYSTDNDGNITGDPIYSKTENIEDSKSITVESAKFSMDKKAVLDAYNKCPNHSGLDFTIKTSVEDAITLDIEKVQPEVKKIFAGEKLNEGEFTFNLYDQDPDEHKDATPIDTAENDSEGKVIFEQLLYTLTNVQNDPYVYYIKESGSQNDEDIKYDTHTIKLEVKVSKGEGNKPAVDVTYFFKNDEGAWTAYNEGITPTFVNAKKPAKTETTPGEGKIVGIGEEITYEIFWANYKNVPATVTVTDKLDKGVDFVKAGIKDVSEPEEGIIAYNDTLHTVTWNLGEKPAGDSGIVTLTVRVNENATLEWKYEPNGESSENDNNKDYQVVNQADVKVGNESDYTNIVENPVPDKEEVAPGDGKLVGVGDEITYKVYWKNGEKEAAEVTITDLLDPGVDYVSSDNGGTHDAATHTVTWSLGVQPAGASGTVTLTVKVNEKAAEGNKYTETPKDTDAFEATGEKDYEVLNRANVKVGNKSSYTNIVENPVPEKEEVTPGDGKLVGIGDEITYEIYWKNGEKEEADVTITDLLDPGVDYVSSDNGGTHDTATHTVTWSLGMQPAGASGTVTLTVKVNEKAAEGNKYTETPKDTDAFEATGEKDYEVLNRASVKVGNESSYTNIVENPVPEKEEVTPGDGKLVGVGDEITYKVYWKNGEKEAAEVTITDLLDPGVDYVSSDNGGTHDAATHTVTWSLGVQPAGASGTVTLTVKVNEKAAEGNKYTETPKDTDAFEATGEKDYEVLNRASVKVGNKSSYTNIVENPVPEKEEITPGDGKLVGVGDEITYKVYWKNGEKEEADVTITDLLDPGVDYVSSDNGGTHDAATHTVTWSLGVQPAGASGTVTLTVKVNEKAAEGNKYTETPKDTDAFEATGEKDYEVLNRANVKVGNKSSYTNIVENPVPEKDEVTPGKGVMTEVGKDITYEIHWKNGHDEPATVTVTDKLDPGVTFKSADNGGTCKDGIVTWTLNAAAAGEAGSEGSVKLTVTVNENAYKTYTYGDGDTPVAGEGKDYEVLNRAAVQVDHDPEVLTNIIPNPVPEKDEVTPGKGVMVEIGQDITYEIHWKNGHDEPVTVTVTDKLDPGVTFKSADNGGTCKDGVVTWTLDAAAAGEAGSEGVVKLTVTVNEDAYKTYTYGDGDTPTAGEGKDYEVLNRATVQVGHDPAVMTEIIPNPVPEKTEVTPGEGVMVGIGQDITYEIHWKNGHDEPATVTVTDKLDPGVTFKSADNGGTCKDGVVTWTLNAAAGEAGSVKLTVTVNENAYDTWQYGSGDKPTAGDGKDYEVLNRAAVQVGHDPKVLTNVIPNPVPEKTEVTPGKGVMVGIGQDITYEIHWKNGHEEPATVTVTDKLDPGVTFKSADNGGTCKDGVVTWTLNAAAAGEAGSEGSVKLTVTVNENAYKTYTYGSGDTPTAGDGKDYEVLNRAGVQVGHDPKVLTNIIPNPVPEKEETDPGANETVYVGDQITYEIHWKNGHDTAADVTVTDPLDEGLDFVSADQGGSYDSATRTVTWVIKNVAAGQSGKVTLVTKVNVNARKDDYIVENQAGVQVGNDPKVLTQIIPNPTPEESRDGTIRVTKELTALGEELYAVDETFYVALFADEACTKRVTDIKALEFKNASSSTVTFKNIDIGRTYYVGEVNADGEVILAGLAEDGTIFTANFNEGKSAVVKNADGSTTVVFENTFEEIPNGFYRSGKLNITKKLLGVDGKAMDSDETFYAGIFADAEYTELSGSVSENIVKLSLGGGSSVSASVDVVCDPEGPTTLYVTEVTEDGRPVGKSFGYTVTVDNGEVSLDVDHTSADVTITNRLKENPESETEEPTKSVKTGDDTPLMGYVLLMLAALAMAIVAETIRRRRRIER